MLCEKDSPVPVVGYEFSMPTNDGRDWVTLGKVTAVRLVTGDRLEVTIDLAAEVMAARLNDGPEVLR